MGSKQPWLEAMYPRVRSWLPAPPAAVLELGCGSVGGFVPALRSDGYQAIGIDPEAPEGAGYRRIEFERSELPDAVDAVVASVSLHHVADTGEVLDRIAGALKPDGRLVFACWAPLSENRHWLISYDIALRHLGPPAPLPAHEPGPLAFGDPDYIRAVLAAAGFAEIAVERAHPTIIGGSPEEEARQAVTMGPTARLIEAKNLDEATRQTIASEIEAAFAAEAAAGPIRLPATIFLVSARRPG